KYLQLIVRENNCEEKVVLFITGVTETALPQFGAGATGTRCAMMPVGDVERGHFKKSMYEADWIGRVPDCVLHAVVGGEVVKRFGHVRLQDHRVYLVIGTIVKKDRAGVRVQGQDVA